MIRTVLLFVGHAGLIGAGYCLASGVPFVAVLAIGTTAALALGARDVLLSRVSS